MRPLRILSLGAGVQSTCVALMSIEGEIEPFDHIIFADTGWERQNTYEHFERLKAAVPTPIHTVTAGNIRDDHMAPSRPNLFIQNPRKYPEWKGRQRTFIPVYVLTPEGDDDMSLGDLDGGVSTRDEPTMRKGKTRRTCTKTYKIEPVEKKIRELLGLKPRQRWPLTHSVDQFFGISLDESERMHDSRRPAIVNHYPLVDMRMTRDDCTAWMTDRGWDVPRSSCVGCPFHRNDEWRDLRDNSPAEFQEAVEFDHRFRQLQADERLPIEGVPFIHDQRVPLDEADIDVPVDAQMSLGDCEGFCGT